METMPRPSVRSAKFLNRFRNFKIADLRQKSKRDFTFFGLWQQLCLFCSSPARKFGAFDSLTLRNFLPFSLFLGQKIKKFVFSVENVKKRLAFCSKSRYCKAMILSLR